MWKCSVYKVWELLEIKLQMCINAATKLSTFGVIELLNISADLVYRGCQNVHYILIWD